MSNHDKKPLNDGWIRWTEIVELMLKKPIIGISIYLVVACGLGASLIYSIDPLSPDVRKFFSLIIVGGVAIFVIEWFKW